MKLIKPAMEILILAIGIMFSVNAWSAPSELVLYLPFDEGEGKTPKDASGKGNDGKFENNPKWVDGKYNKALEFDGSSHVQVPLSKSLEELTKDFSVDFWAKRSDTQPGTWNYMVAADRVRWAVIYNSDQKVYVWASNPNWAQQAVTTEPLPKDWTHIAATFDTKDKVKIRFNGKVVGESAAKPNETIPITQCYEIGAIATAGGCPAGEQFFRGIIDEVAIYKGILTEDEIKRDMGGNVGGIAAVRQKDKLAAIWGMIKNQY
jgi:hypothetical protein